MLPKDHRLKVLIILLPLALTAYLHYAVPQSYTHFHQLLGIIQFFPLILAGFWFGVKGALAVWIVFTVLYAPYFLFHWQGFSINDVEQVIAGVLYLAASLLLGYLSDRQKVQQKKIRQAEQLAAIGQAVSVVAHEMKTPLVAIGGFTNSVKKQMDPSHPDYMNLNIVLNETKRLENLVKDMLDYSREIQLERTACSIHPFLQECIELITASMQHQTIKIITNTTTLPDPISIDPMRMKQVVLNLLSNAVDATPKGESIKLILDYKSQKLWIDIHDQGIGIPNDLMPKVFQPFVTAKKKGTGLGLPIAKKIVEAHGGDIILLRNSPSGVIARVTLPVD